MEFREDCYIYDEQNNRLGKWFTRLGELKTVWNPSLEPENLEKIEAIYNKYVERQKNQWAKISKVLQAIYKSKHVDDKYKESKIAYACPTHDYKSSESFVYWKYRVHPFCLDDSILSYGFDWSKKPKILINFKLGQELYKLDRYHTNVCSRMSKVAIALEECIQRKLKPLKKKENLTVRLVINDRDYFYGCEYARSSNYLHWAKIIWPEDKTVVVEA